MCSDGDDVTCAGGSPFQTRAAETGKARSPTLQRRDVGTTSASHDDERSCCLDSRSDTSCKSSAINTMVLSSADNDRRAWPACILNALLRSGLDLVSGWLVVRHTYLFYFTLPMSLSQHARRKYCYTCL